MGEVAGRLSGDADYVRLGQNPQETAKRLGQGLKVEKNGFLEARGAGVLRGAQILTHPITALAGAGIVTNLYEENQNPAPKNTDPANFFPGYKRYLSPQLYRYGTHLQGVSAGLVDGAIDMGASTRGLVLGMGKYLLAGVSKLLSAGTPTGQISLATIGAEKFDAYNDYGDELLDELKDFIDLYLHDGDFRREFHRQLGDELKGYFERLGGMSGEHGYGQGRLIFDIATLFAGGGALKGITNSWKRVRQIDLKWLLSKLKKPEQKLIKTETIGRIDGAF